MEQIIKGWVVKNNDYWADEDEIYFSKRDNKKIDDEDDGRQLRILMANALEKLGAEDLKADDDYEEGISGRYQVDSVQVQLFSSDKRTKLDDIRENVVLNAMGLLDFEERWYGYSSWTIEGFNTQTFQLGGHDMLEILKAYEGKWVYLVIDIVH